MRNAMWVGGGITGMGGIPMLGTGARGLTTLIREIFRNGEQGFAYDPNDLTTLYQDAAGTIPVTAVGQPVGLILDKSKGLVLGVEQVIGGDFEAGLIGTKYDASGSVSTWELNALSPISGTQDGKLTITTASASRPSLLFPTNRKYIGEVYELSFDYKVISGTAKVLGVYDGVDATIYNTVLTGSGRATFRYTIRSSNINDFIYFSDSVCTIQIDNISVKQVLGNHAYQTVSASRPILRQNATTGANYLEFDGLDDFYVTNSINFTATDKVSLFAGVRKLSDAANGVLLETSIAFTGGLGTFCLFTPRFTGTAGNFGFGSKGTIVAEATTPAILAPTSVVVSTQASISTNKINLRINGILSASSNNSQGAGNYGNHPLYIGRRGGTYLPFNGHLYSLIGVARLSTDAETTSLEKAIAKNTGVTLNV